MTRQILWVAAALTLSVSLLTHDNRAVAQQTGDASAEAEADASDANADASADANATESSDQADAQADAQATTSDDSAQADAQATTNDDSADDEAPATSNDSQSAKSDSQNTQGSDLANKNQSSQDTGPALPQPSTPNDPNAKQPPEQSRLTEGQQSDQQDTAADRRRADDSAQGRAKVDARTGRDRQSDLRAGIRFGRATDRGLTINHIEQNSFLFRSGFRSSDVIVSVHGRPVRSDADFMRFIVLQPGQRVPVVVWRDGRRETIYVVHHDVAHHHPGYDNRTYQAGGAYLGVTFDAQARDAAVVLGVNPGSPAHEAGLQPGDILVALDGREVRSYPDAISIIRGMRPGDELEIVVERARAQRQIVAMLDAPPSVRTAARPEVLLERRTITTDPSARVQLRIEDRDADDRARDRDSDNDRSRGRTLLPRFRD